MTHYGDHAAEACTIYNRIASRVLNGGELGTSIETEITNTIYEPILTNRLDCPHDGYSLATAV